MAVDDIGPLAPQAIVISPGPCTPAEAGISVPLVRFVEDRCG
jgi:anthranilate/para-aminobenzoate synthase component II